MVRQVWGEDSDAVSLTIRKRVKKTPAKSAESDNSTSTELEPEKDSGKGEVGSENTNNHLVLTGKVRVSPEITSHIAYGTEHSVRRGRSAL